MLGHSSIVPCDPGPGAVCFDPPAPRGRGSFCAAGSPARLLELALPRRESLLHRLHALGLRGGEVVPFAEIRREVVQLRLGALVASPHQLPVALAHPDLAAGPAHASE
ncbi:MAG: hypothetical protein ACYTGG_05645 [Planctomycetota bacterium]|jgi:hypothetical protein